MFCFLIYSHLNALNIIAFSQLVIIRCAVCKIVLSICILVKYR